MTNEEAVIVIEKNYLCEIENSCTFDCDNCRHNVTPAELKDATELAVKALTGGSDE